MAREQGIAGGESCARHARFWDCPALTEAKILGEKDAKCLIKVRTDIWLFRSCCLCFSVATTLKYIAVNFPGRLCFSVQCLGERIPWEQGSHFLAMKLIFCQNASLNSLSFPAFSGILQEMLAAYKNIKYKGCNVGLLSTYISRDEEVLMAVLLFLSSAQQKNQLELLFLFSLICYLEGLRQRSFP